MKNTITAFFLGLALTASAQQQPSTVVANTITAQASLPAAQAAPLLAAAQIPSGFIQANPDAGTIIIRGQAVITLPASAITNLVVPPNGIDPTNFVSGKFIVDTNGVFQITGVWTTKNP